MGAPKSDYGSEALASDWINEIAKLVVGDSAISIAGAAGTQTLSSTEYRARALNLTGTITGNRAVVVPADAGRVWLVLNSTTGAFTVTVKTSGGVGVVVSPGSTMLLWTDGTDVLPVQQSGHLALAISDANQTLTAEQYTRRIIEFTGTLTAGRTITMPLLPGWAWTVTNATGQTLTFKVSGGTGIPVATGKAAGIFCGAADIKRASADV